MTQFDLFALLRELILPPASLFILFVAGVLLAKRYVGAGRMIAASAIALLYLLCSGFGTLVFVAPLEALTSPLSSSNAKGAQAIVVLAAGRIADAPEYGGAEQPDYIALARLRYAARLQRETGLPILVSGGNGTEDGRFKPKALAMKRALEEEFGVPVRWVEPASANTAQNAEFSARSLKQENIRRILLVTDAMHMPRAVMAFKGEGLEVVAAPTVFFGSTMRAWLYPLPTAENLRRTYYALYEWIGLVWYKLRNVPPT
ncbi:YdcF family protein [Noviherbaspirillum denitrificans]|uniref:DUF218 domain-containing protein n=1 Tax=Noviherbaspirillum denitrificans TaxID=1968433 RepID=A0A254TGH8_9BURK|nr:YdcF family protein [Noviherbaspirillum denitrificans]OWW20402.1 hypothetical protein AYR66_13820 [Noviherbaspirillum denitrificans]